jgi:hypothetical protein
LLHVMADIACGNSVVRSTAVSCISSCRILCLSNRIIEYDTRLLFFRETGAHIIWINTVIINYRIPEHLHEFFI